MSWTDFIPGAGIVKTAIGLGQEVLEGKREERRLEHKKRLELLSDRAEWEHLQIERTDHWLRRVAFAVIVMPYVWALFDAEGVQRYFSVALEAVPGWWQQLTLAAFGAVWGLRELAGGARRFQRERRRRAAAAGQGERQGAP